MSIQDQEKQLFREWSSKRPDFVRDGVVDESEYLASDKKLLFVLKEVNDSGGGGWDLREFIRAGARWQTWNNITRWVEGIRKLPNDLNWDSLHSINESKRRKILASIAVINLKKSPGGHTADSSRLSEATEIDRAYINRQFELYDPDFVICCGSETSVLFHSVIESGKPSEWRRTSRGVWYYELSEGKPVIAYSHPGARCASFLLYYGLIDAVRVVGGYALQGAP